MPNTTTNFAIVFFPRQLLSFSPFLVTDILSLFRLESVSILLYKEAGPSHCANPIFGQDSDFGSNANTGSRSMFQLGKNMFLVEKN